jgi:lysophospholipase L1-like esterase
MRRSALPFAVSGVLLALAAPALAQPRARLAPGDRYVAMGSSFASGPRITSSADAPPNRCARSADNYAHQLARRHGLALTDVSCSGATTAHLLGPWNELPPQIEAVDAATKLVTVTVGGNDVNYNRGLSAMGCATAAAPAVTCPVPPPAPTQADFDALEAHLRQIAQAVRQRAPSARLLFVDYPQVLPPDGTCPALSLTGEQAARAREIDRRVVGITRKAALAAGGGLVSASQLSTGHDACSAQPWTNGFSAPPGADGAAYHPNLASHTAVAQAIGRLIAP